MGNRLEGKNAIVTAAGQGIGKATAITFHNEGAKVTATDINNETLADLNKEYPNISVKKLDEVEFYLKDMHTPTKFFLRCLLKDMPVLLQVPITLKQIF